jgi:hypothetical protein
MARRRAPPDALDFFPIPLWASRGLFRRYRHYFTPNAALL